jgi:MOSC domain-containing protein YiiM
VNISTTHSFSKAPQPSGTLIAGMGFENDAHSGKTVKHRSRVAKSPNDPNLRQVHLIHEELFDEVASGGFCVNPGDMGENLTTSGIDLLNLPRGTRLRVGDSALIEVTGLRSPCSQIEGFQEGLLAAMLDRDAEGNVIRKSGVMGVVLEGGDVRPGDAIQIFEPDGERMPLQPV